MIAFVVDTNVAKVANGDSEHTSAECEERCIDKIVFLVNNGCVILDEEGLILDEYSKHLEWGGKERGVGDEFFIHLNNCYADQLVRRVVITPSEDDSRGFEELPQNRLDPSDRKFLAVALVSGAVIVNATDSDWSEQQTLTDCLGVEIEQLCPEYAHK